MNNSKEEYLETLYNLEQENEPAVTGIISKRLNIAPASVTEMIKKLADEGYVNHTPYQAVTLTLKGKEIGEKMTRKHRLLERFLHDTLKMDSRKVHIEACAMEHSLSDEAERAMCQVLNSPNKCPDDEKVIPACNLGFSSCEECKNYAAEDIEKVGKRKTNVIPLSNLKENQHGKIAFLRGDKKVLRRLLDMGLTPGTRVQICRIAPLKGPTEVKVRGCKLALGDEVACNVFLEDPAG